MLGFHPELQMGSIFPKPIIPNKLLMTLDLDGSYIYIGF